ncbi:MAG: PD-(D/E)XK nuclease family protein [Phormidesmis sp.]
MPEIRQLLVYGYFQPSQGELVWLNALAAPDSVVFLPQGESVFFKQTNAAIDWLTQQGWEVMTGEESFLVGVPQMTVPLGTAQLCKTFLDSSHLETPHSNVVVHSYSTFEAEVRGTLAQVKALRSAGVSARDIVIVARDEKAYGPKLLDIAWEYDVPLRALYSTPLLTTRLGAWIQRLLSVVDLKFPFEETAKLLSHPLCSNPDSDFWAAARQTYPSGFQAWHEIVASHLDIDLTNLGRTRQERRRDTWVEWISAVFKSFDLRRRCARWARESVAFNSLQKALVEVSKPEADRLAWTDFKRQMEDLLESVTVPAQPGRGGVELHSPASMVGAQYGHLFVMGMADGVLPPAVSNDPVLDFFERSRLKHHGINLPSATALFNKEALDFYFLLQAATDQITFSYSRLRDRKEQLPSAYLSRMNIVATPLPERPIASQEEQRQLALQQREQGEEPIDAVLAAAVNAFEVESYRESSHTANEYDGVIDVAFDHIDWTFSVSQLTMLGQCPFKWFTKKILKLGSPTEADTDLTPSLRGNLYHKVVELLVAAVQANSELTLTDSDLLREKFLEAEEAISLPALPAWNRQREDHLRTLSTVLRKPDFLPSGAEPLALEERFEGEWEGLSVTGRIDRIDRTPDGLTLIDYKTSSQVPKGLKDSNGKASIDLQLALYRDVATMHLFLEETVTAAQYFSLTKGKILKKSAEVPHPELPVAVENCKEALRLGRYPVQPDIKGVACNYCDFDLVCRKGNRLTRKENDCGAN